MHVTIAPASRARQTLARFVCGLTARLRACTQRSCPLASGMASTSFGCRSSVADDVAKVVVPVVLTVANERRTVRVRVGHFFALVFRCFLIDAHLNWQEKKRIVQLLAAVLGCR